MAVQVEVKLVCDYCAMTDKGVERASRTRRWGLDGEGFEIEVCEKHDDQLSRDLDSWRRASRKAGTKAKEISRGKAKKSVRPRPYDKTEYFAWAKEKGYKVDESKTPRGITVKRFLDEKYPESA